MLRSRAVLPAFLVAEALALVGNAAFVVVFPWLVLAMTGSVARTAVVAAVTTLPTMLASLASGGLIDRIGRRRASILAGAGCALAASGFGLLDGTTGLPVAAVVALGLAVELFVAPATTARDALMGDVAADSGAGLDRVAGARQVVFSLAFLVGPAGAGFVLAALGPIAALWGLAGLWTVSALLTTTLPDHPHPDDGVPTTAGAPRSVWSTVRAHPGIRAAVVIGFGSSVITGPMTSVVLPAHFQRLAEPSSYGLVMSAFAVGSVLGALGYAAIPARRRGTGFVVALAVTTTGMVGFAVLPTTLLLAASLAAVGAGSGVLAPMLLVAVTRHSGEHERGRVLGIYNAAGLGASPLGLGLLSLLLLVADLPVAAWSVLVVWVLVAAFALSTRRALTVPAPEPATAGAPGC
jgi:MFS family permease